MLLASSTDISHKDDVSGPLAVAVSQSVEGSGLVEAHSHVRGQLLGVWHGLLTLGTSAGKWLVPRVHAVWIPGGQQHWAGVHGVVDAWSVYLRPSACEALPTQPATLKVSALLLESVRRLTELDSRKGGAMRALLEQVVVQELLSLPVQALNLSMPNSTALMKIAQGLVADPADARSLEAWAAIANISPRTLNRRFPVETGYSFGAWRQRLRLLRSLERLAEGHSVTTVALELGYANISAFIALFKRTFGSTPGRYIREA